MASAAELDLQSCLAPFKLSSFRPGQQEVISTVLAGQDCLCVMPTGGGKSLCYQLPAVARPGLTLVISPLIALMKDQVDSLTALGLRATFVNSTLSPDEQQQRLTAMAAGQYDLVYVVPERFRSPRFLEAVRQADLKLLAVDEAHCISQWGHDFRPDYARLGRFRRQLGDPPTIALTATATEHVRRDIIELLELRDPRVFITGFARPNLRYEVRQLSQRKKPDALVDFLQSNPGPSIVYVSSRNRCEEIAQYLAQQTRRSVSVYHAGMMSDERRRAQDAFMRGGTEVIVATNAFGMGIDKADVRSVVHYNLPGSIEAYYQEAGRAGRDGQPATCLLLYSQADRYTHDFFIQTAYPSRAIVERVYNYLRSLEDDPIELTQQEILDSLNLPIGAEGIGACEKLLEVAGAVERLEAVENMAGVRLNSDLPTLVDLVSPQAKVKRKVLRALEQVVGEQRREWVYFRPQDLVRRTEMDSTALSQNLRELAKLQAVDYLPPFRGRAVRVLRREAPLEALEIDFAVLDERRAAEYDKLATMVRFALGRSCRQREILAYFGQSGSDACRRCDNCQTSTSGKTATGQTSVGPRAAGDPILQAVRIVLSGVARANGRCGKQLIAQMLCGSAAEKVVRNRLDRLSTFGLLRYLKQPEVAELIDALIATGYLEQTEVDRFRPVLQLTPQGTEVMSSRADLGGGLALSAGLFEKLRRGDGSGQATPVEDRLPDLNDDLLSKLRTWRDAVSTARNLQPYLIFPNATLEELARVRPQSMEALRGVKGIGDIKLQQYGETLLEIMVEHRAADGSTNTTPTSSEVPPEPQESVELEEVAPPSEPGDQASHYWTWRLLCAGFGPDDCAAIRGLSREVVLDHALRAAESGWKVRADWFLSPEVMARLEQVIGPGQPARIRPLLARLPNGTRYEEVQLFLKCRGV